MTKKTARLGWLEELGDMRDLLPPASKALLDGSVDAS